MGPRQFNRSVLRAHIDELRWRNELDAVRSRVSPAVAALLDNPRSAPAWLGGEAFDEINAAIYALHGREGLRGFLFSVMQTGLIKVLEPVIQFALNFLGSGPPAVFGRSDMMLAVNTRNVEMRWKQTSDFSGEVTVLCGEAVPPITWIAWEGVFGYILHLAAVKGTVAEAVPGADGHSARIDLRWEPR
ncbi:MAG TPA: hypothetical protein VLW85_20545 [Myxococcales bacterium]|nr:hypothetical protein [Myxococcales bacterium]